MFGKRILSSVALVVGFVSLSVFAACGGGGAADDKTDGMGGSGGAEGGASGGNSPSTSGGAPGSGGGGASGGATATGGSGGADALPATGGIGGMAGANMASGGAAATGGMTATGGIKGMVDAKKEQVWINADITFGTGSSIQHNQPMNWFSPIDYYNGSMAVRADVSTAPAAETVAPTGFYGLELCIYKSGPNDDKHDCLPLAYRLKGTGVQTKLQPKTSIILRNTLARDVVSEADFMTPWAANNTRLVAIDHSMSISGPVKTKLTIVLIPAGYTFSGWQNYPN